jgi:hypothetical protein
VIWAIVEIVWPWLPALVAHSRIAGFSSAGWEITEQGVWPSFAELTLRRLTFAADDGEVPFSEIDRPAHFIRAPLKIRFLATSSNRFFRCV